MELGKELRRMVKNVGREFIGNRFLKIKRRREIFFLIKREFLVFNIC